MAGVAAAMLTMTSDEARKNESLRLALATLLKDDFEVEQLYVGDFAALDTPLSLGIERKTFANLVHSLASNELDEQLSKMLDTYDVTVALIEDMPVPRPDGKVRVHGAKKDYSYSWLLGSLGGWFLRGVFPLLVPAKATPLAIVTLYKLVAKPEHREMYAPKKVLGNLRRMSLVERVMLQFPGIGEKKVKEFRDESLADLAIWPVEVWQDKLGKVTGRKVSESWH